MFADNSSCGLPSFKGDKYCDDENNNKGCSYDGGDCCADEVKGGIPYCTYCTTCLCHIDQKHACSKEATTAATTIKELTSSILGKQKIIYDRQYIHISYHI